MREIKFRAWFDPGNGGFFMPEIQNDLPGSHHIQMCWETSDSHTEKSRRLADVNAT